jgi:hypothetical protein
MSRRAVLLFVAAALAAAVIVWISSREETRTLYMGGPILSMDPANSVVAALAVEGDRIAAVGSREELGNWADGNARVVDLRGPGSSRATSTSTALRSER